MGAETFLPVAFVVGYLLGSIPFGLILTRLAGTEDLRSIGSGNIGATNVLRTGKKSLAAATLLGDMLKGTVAVIIAGTLWGPNAAMLAGLGAFWGGEHERWAMRHAYALAPTASFSRCVLESCTGPVAVSTLPAGIWRDVGSPEPAIRAMAAVTGGCCAWPS